MEKVVGNAGPILDRLSGVEECFEAGDTGAVSINGLPAGPTFIP